MPRRFPSGAQDGVIARLAVNDDVGHKAIVRGIQYDRIIAVTRFDRQ